MAVQPVQKGNKKDTFRALVDSFKMNEKIFTFLLDSPMENLDE